MTTGFSRGVRETSEVRLNGELQGVRSYGRHWCDLAGRLEPGGNELEFTVTSTAPWPGEGTAYRARRVPPKPTASVR